MIHINDDIIGVRKYFVYYMAKKINIYSLSWEYQWLSNYLMEYIFFEFWSKHCFYVTELIYIVYHLIDMLKYLWFLFKIEC